MPIVAVESTTILPTPFSSTRQSPPPTTKGMSEEVETSLGASIASFNESNDVANLQSKDNAEQLVQQENRAVTRTKLVVVTTLVVFAISLGLMTFFVISNSENDSFEDEVSQKCLKWRFNNLELTVGPTSFFSFKSTQEN
jgi:hypothetical protein